MNGLETEIAAALHDGVNASVPVDAVDVDRLADGSRRRGQALRRRYRAAGVAAGCAVVLLAAGVVTVPRWWPHSPRVSGLPAVAGPSSTPDPTPGLQRPPVLTGAPSALTDPDAIGQVQGFHLDLAATPVPVIWSTWSTGNGSEDLQLALAGPGTIEGAMIGIGPQQGSALSPPRSEPTEVNGRPAAITVQTLGRAAEVELRWKPTDGVAASVKVTLADDTEATARAHAMALAGALRLDHTYRCVTAARLRTVPAGTKQITCIVLFKGVGRPVDTNVVVGAASWSISVVVQSPQQPSGGTSTTVDGRPATQLSLDGPNGTVVRQLWIDWGGGRQVHVTGEGPYSAQQFNQIVGGIEVQPGTDPAGWPTGPLN